MLQLKNDSFCGQLIWPHKCESHAKSVQKISTQFNKIHIFLIFRTNHKMIAGQFICLLSKNFFYRKIISTTCQQKCNIQVFTKNNRFGQNSNFSIFRFLLEDTVNLNVQIKLWDFDKSDESDEIDEIDKIDNGQNRSNSTDWHKKHINFKFPVTDLPRSNFLLKR